jgi:hypothetical protein
MIGRGFVGSLGGALVGLAALAILGSGCDADDTSREPELLFDLPDASPGDIVGLVARDDLDEPAVEWIDRLDGTIHRLSVGNDTVTSTVVARIPVGADGEQRGLLGQVVVDGRRFAAWTQPDTFELVVGEITGGDADTDAQNSNARIIWSAGEASSGAIGGVLDELDGRILVGVGRNTGFDRETGVGGAILALDPDGTADQEPEEISVGYTNPWAFTAIGDEIWVADNAAGPDPADDTVDDIERIGRADLLAERADMTRIAESGRAPTAMIALPDGRLAICGFLDNELRAYEIIDGADADPPNPATEERERAELERAGTIMPCITGAAIFDDGAIVTAALGDPGMQLTILQP